MFKLGSFEQELEKAMQKNLISNQLEKKGSFEKLAKVTDYLVEAARILDETGFQKEADVVTKILASLANEKTLKKDLPDDYEQCWECNFDHEYEPAEAQDWHKNNPNKEYEILIDNESASSDELKELLDSDLQAIKKYPKEEYLEFKSLDSDLQNNKKMFPKEEFLEFKSMAAKLTKKLNKKKV